LGSHLPHCNFPPLPTRSMLTYLPNSPSLPPSHDNSELQEAVRICSAGFASPLLPPHIAFSKSFGTVVHGLVVSHGWDQHTRHPMFYSVDRRYFFELHFSICSDAFCRNRPDSSSRVAVACMETQTQQVFFFFPLPHSLTATSLPNTSSPFSP
jgi:hypothetical protein